MHGAGEIAPETATATDERGSMEIRFLGHACFELVEGDTRLLIDPFLTGNPRAGASADDLHPTHVLLTHGHPDHYGDAVAIAKRTGAHCIAIHEIALELRAAGLESVAGPNLGGTATFDGGWVRLVPAWHTSTTPSGAVNTPAGLVIRLGDTTVYHLGDTALFSDLSLVAERDHIDVVLMCIGGFYTMDRHDAVKATELLKPDVVIPCHFNTQPLVETDAEAFKVDVEAVTSSRVVILEPGESHRA
jgi:L-ascorbate metabolism protein UlaG (beta-lactamase superfamily)